MSNELSVVLRWDFDDGQSLMFREYLPPTLSRSLHPLPEGRELSGWEAMAALEQMDRRREACKAMGTIIAVALMDMIEQRDTVAGYQRAELYPKVMEVKRNARP